MGKHACRSGPVDHLRFTCLRGDLDGLSCPPHRSDEMIKRSDMFVVVTLSALLSACGGEAESLQYGTSVDLPEPKRGILPDMVIAEPAEWGDRLPTVPEGYTVSAIATDLKIPRQTLVLPNGDILVAEGRGGMAPDLKPKDVIAA